MKRESGARSLRLFVTSEIGACVFGATGEIGACVCGADLTDIRRRLGSGLNCHNLR